MFEKLEKPEEFFNLLPEDWKEGLVPVWGQYADSSEIWVLKEKDTIIAGGIVFSVMPPDLYAFLSEAKALLDRGSRYLGFIWVVPEQRGRGLGSAWLKALFAHYPKVSFWLTIEEEGLKHFYRQNGFMLKGYHKEPEEWLFVRA